MDVALAPDLTVACALLPAMVALKILAWGVRNAYTDKDAEDLGALLDASHSGVFEDPCWEDDDAGRRWDYDPFLMGPYRLGQDIGGDFTSRSSEVLLTHLSGDRLDRLVQRMSPGPVSRHEQLEALAVGLYEVRHENP